jgi:hypothetical protein
LYPKIFAAIVRFSGSTVRNSKSPVAVTPVACPNSAIAHSNHDFLIILGAIKSTQNTLQATPQKHNITSGTQFSATTSILIVATALTTRKSRAAPEMRSI